MAFYVDNNGDITLMQGDSGALVISGLNTDKNYKVYFAVHDKNRHLVGNELYVNSNMQDSVIIQLTAGFTDLLTVKKNAGYEIYYYGIKACYESENLEDTLIIGNSQLGDLNTITVFPKKVEGNING